MTYLLFLLSIGLGTALIFKEKQLKRSKYDQATAKQRLNEADEKYGGLISKEDTSRALDKQIDTLSDRLRQMEKGGQVAEDKISVRLSVLEKQSEVEQQQLSAKISALRVKLQGLEEQENIEAFGFYESKYDFQGAGNYKDRLDKVRAQQKQMIKDGKAAVCHTEWNVGGSLKEGKKMTNNFIKLVLRAFNGECDASVMKVKYSNISTMENRVRKTYDDLNKLSETTNCDVTTQYLDLKLQELWLTHEYQERKYQEQEEQRIIRDQMREEEKAIRELEKAKQDAEREEQRYQEALDKARSDVESATGKAQEKLLSQIEVLQQRLLEAEMNTARAVSQAQLTKSGHVYIISNIGSFGENVYKIGMTRRLEPMDRVKELGDASVPFPFDVHAMIFCKNAPELESRLHKRFYDRRVNKANERKEFFRVSLEEIVQTVQKIDEELKTCKSEVTFTKVAEAADYRKTLSQEREPKKISAMV
jgi:Domain of unknown function (DUF4041)/T5orf172 domain